MPEPDAADVFEDIRRGAAHPRSSGRGLTVRHLAPFFNATVWSGFDDGEDVRAYDIKLGKRTLILHVQSFFTIYRNLFARLAHEESQYVEAELPSFGYSTWPWVAPSKADAETAARLFYTYWTNFATEKDFAWTEQWNLAEAPDRRVRRRVLQIFHAESGMY